MEVAKDRDELPGNVAPVIFVKQAGGPGRGNFALDMLANEEGKTDFGTILVKRNEAGNRDTCPCQALKRVDLRQYRIGANSPFGGPTRRISLRSGADGERATKL